MNSFRTFLVLSCLLFGNLFQVKAQQFDWVKIAGQKGDNDGYSIVADAAGNTYTTGQYSNSITFGSFTLTGSPTAHNFYVVKYSPAGEVLWARTAVSSGSIGFNIALDKNNNCYITGSFSFNISFPGKTLTNSAQTGGDFIVKYNTNGVVQWATEITDGASYNTNLAVDEDGNSYVVGNRFSPLSNFNGFLIKFDNSGKKLWVKEYTNLVAKDIKFATNRLYITGTMENTASLGTINLTSNGNSDIFVAKLTTNGVTEWAKNIGSSRADAGVAIALNSQGNCFVIGNIGGAFFVSGQPIRFRGQVDVAVAQFSDAGVLNWAVGAGGPNYDDAFDLVVDKNDMVYVTGHFQNSMTFGDRTISGSGKINIFLTRIFPNGQFNLTCQPIISDKIEGKSIAADDGGNLYLTGLIAGQTKFNELTITAGIHSFFITRINPSVWPNCLIINPTPPNIDPPLPNEPTKEPDFSFVIPNIITPNGDGLNDVFQIENVGAYDIISLWIFNRFGQKVYFDAVYNNTWSGQFVSAGTYYYKFEVQKSGVRKSFTGWVEVVK